MPLVGPIFPCTGREGIGKAVRERPHGADSADPGGTEVGGLSAAPLGWRGTSSFHSAKSGKITSGGVA